MGKRPRAARDNDSRDSRGANDMKSPIVIATLMMFALGAPAASQSRCRFPSPITTCVSPSGNLTIEWHQPSADGKHALWLKSASGSRPRILLAFDRSVELLWSPDGQALAVTDHAGSNQSDLLVYTGASLLRAVDVQAQLLASLGPVSEIFENSHRYFEIINWISSNMLRFRVRAYDSTPAKEYVAVFRYELAGRVSRER